MAETVSDPNVIDVDSALASATDQEKCVVLGQLLVEDPDLRASAERLARTLISSADEDSIADEIVSLIGGLEVQELAARAGRIPGRGYVHETDAAWELLEETLHPYHADIRRRSSLGLSDAATAIVSGVVAGLDRLQRSPDGLVISFAGDDAVDMLIESVLDLADSIDVVAPQIPRLQDC